MRLETKNKLFFYFSYALRSAAMLCASGALIQTFLSTIGFSADQIYIHTSLIQATNVTTILLCSGFADSKSIIKRAAIVQIPTAVLFLAYIPFCIAAKASFTAYLLLVVIAVLHAVFNGLNTVCEYKLPYLIFRPESYGVVLAVSGILSGILSLGIGAIVSFLTSRFAYTQVMLFAFLSSTFFLLLSAWFHFCMRELSAGASEAHPVQDKKHVPLLTVFRHPAFLHLLPANILRGFAYGTTTVFAVIALKLGYGESVRTAIVSVQSAAHLIGCAVFGILSRYIHPRFSIVVGSAFFLFLPLLLIPNAGVYLAAAGAVMLGRDIINNAVPAGLRYAVPAEIAGPYNAWRMVIHNGASLLATTVAILLPLPVLLVLTVVAQLLSGASFLLLRVMRGETKPKEKRK